MNEVPVLVEYSDVCPGKVRARLGVTLAAKKLNLTADYQVDGALVYGIETKDRSAFLSIVREILEKEG